MKKNIYLFLMLTVLTAALSAGDFGSAGAAEREQFGLEDMLNYAIQDEHLALAEYEALMEEFGLDRPYSNIARSERTHIAYLEELYGKYGLTVPEVRAQDHLVLPDSPAEAARIGVDAEIANIAMYEKFLAEDLPEDVREVFSLLKKSSENHLRAFSRQVSASPAGRGGRSGRTM